MLFTMGMDRKFMWSKTDILQPSEVGSFFTFIDGGDYSFEFEVESVRIGDATILNGRLNNVFILRYDK